MRHTSFPPAAAIFLSACASAGAGPGDPSTVASAPTDNPFRYDVPSPPTATYQLADTHYHGDDLARRGEEHGHGVFQHGGIDLRRRFAGRAGFRHGIELFGEHV